jgi:hypothetical protein
VNVKAAKESAAAPEEVIWSVEQGRIVPHPGEAGHGWRWNP